MPAPHILAPTDFSKAARVGLEAAAEHAHATRGRITLAYVYHASVLTLPDDPAPDDPNVPVEEFLRERLKALEDTVFGGVDTTSMLLAGSDAAATLSDFIAHNEVDLVVMATRGRSALAKMLIGSVTEKLIRAGDCPVLCVPVRSAAK